MFILANVLVGDSVDYKNLPYSHKIARPPVKDSDKNVMYDSIYDSNNGFYVIYDSSKVYPEFIICHQPPQPILQNLPLLL
jgi:hypothetical protein